MADGEKRGWMSPLALVALAAAAYLAWRLRTELVVLFAAVLFGVTLYSLARWLSRRTGWSHRVSVVLWFVTGLLLAGGFLVFAGQRLQSQYGEFGSRLPAALETLEGRLEDLPVVGGLSGEIADIRKGMTSDGGESPPMSEAEQQEVEEQRTRIVRITLSTVSFFVFWVFVAFFLAFDGRSYLHSLLRLVPPDRRCVGEDLAQALGRALPWWLAGRLSSMAVVAVLTIPGLLLLGIPLAVLLGVIAGLFSFVPFVGPISSVIPAVLITLEAAPEQLIWVLGLYALVQFLESNLITPLIQKEVAHVPPALLISAQLLAGALVGIIGLVFATPLALAVVVTVQVLYLRHGLGEEVETPHDGEAR